MWRRKQHDWDVATEMLLMLRACKHIVSANFNELLGAFFLVLSKTCTVLMPNDLSFDPIVRAFSLYENKEIHQCTFLHFFLTGRTLKQPGFPQGAMPCFGYLFSSVICHDPGCMRERWLKPQSCTRQTLTFLGCGVLVGLCRTMGRPVQSSWKQGDYGWSSCRFRTSFHLIPYTTSNVIAPTTHVSCISLKSMPQSKRVAHAKQCSLELGHRTHTLLFLLPALLLTIIAQMAEGTCNSIPATFLGPVERTGPAPSLDMALRTNCWQLGSSQGSLQG